MFYNIIIAVSVNIFVLYIEIIEGPITYSEDKKRKQYKHSKPTKKKIDNEWTNDCIFMKIVINK